MTKLVALLFYSSKGKKMEMLCRMWSIPGMSVLALSLIDYEEKYVEVITYLP